MRHVPASVAPVGGVLRLLSCIIAGCERSFCWVSASVLQLKQSIGIAAQIPAQLEHLFGVDRHGSPYHIEVFTLKFYTFKFGNKGCFARFPFGVARRMSLLKLSVGLGGLVQFNLIQEAGIGAQLPSPPKHCSGIAVA